MGLKIRQFRLRKSDNSRWNLTPDNPQLTYGGSAFLNVKGLGYSNSIGVKQVDNDYLVTDKATKNTSITGTLYFVNDTHIKNFMQWIGSLDNELEFRLSPNGDVIATDIISDSRYKKVVINKFEKGEKNIYGWYEVNVTFLTLSDIWYRDKKVVSKDASQVGTPHTYPYFYPYVYGGKNVLAVDINNQGREIGCLVKIKNTSTVALTNPEWTLETPKKSVYDEEYISYQYAKFNLSLPNGYELIVDSNATTQKAEVLTKNGVTLNQVNSQEPDYQYINFVRLANGQNRLIFNIDVASADIEISYQLQSEVAY